MNRYSIVTLLLAINFNSLAKANDNRELINCQGTQGALVNRCQVAQETVLAGVQAHESEFRIDYVMTCNRGYRGPKSSFISAVLDNGQSLNLQYNHEGSSLLVGTGVGPLILRDSKPIDLINMQFNECKLTITNVNVRPSARLIAEWEAEKSKKRAVHLEYLRLTQDQIKLNANHLMTNQSNLFFRTNQKVASACLIHRYESDPLYLEISADLKNNYRANFGEEYSVSADLCESRVIPRPSLNGLTCDLFTTEGLQKMLARNLSQADRFFYETCLIENNNSDLIKWFQAKRTELTNVIAEVERDGLADIRENLEALLTNISTALYSSCTEAPCHVVDILLEN